MAFAPALSLAQQEGYNYDPPDNPLVITRPEQPTPAPRRPPPQQPSYAALAQENERLREELAALRGPRL